MVPPNESSPISSGGFPLSLKTPGQQRLRRAKRSLAARLRDPSLLGSFEQKTAGTRINLQFVKLGLRLNANNRVVLAGVDGRLDAGSVTAIMGPSGAGKTTFMNALSGRANYGRVTGKILINGVANSVSNLSNLVGFVPQEDTMHRELTVGTKRHRPARH